MNKTMIPVRVMALGALVAGLAQTAIAVPVTVLNTGTSPGVTLSVNLPWVPYNGGALVGVENLLIDNVATKGYCIDLYHFAAVNQSIQYNIVPLDLSPSAIPPGNMGVAKADFIKEMWAQYYATSLTVNNQAAGFQLAIWGVLQGTIAGGISAPDWTWLAGGATTAATYGADSIINWANNNNGALANVVGLNAVVDGPQSYAIPGIPDGGLTLVLLGMGLTGLATLRRKLSV